MSNVRSSKSSLRKSKKSTPGKRLDDDIARMRAAMAEASRFVLAGFELATDVKIVRWPDRYSDPRGAEMWDHVCNLVLPAEPQRRTA